MGWISNLLFGNAETTHEQVNRARIAAGQCIPSRDNHLTGTCEPAYGLGHAGEGLPEIDEAPRYTEKSFSTGYNARAVETGRRAPMVHTTHGTEWDYPIDIPAIVERPIEVEFPIRVEHDSVFSAWKGR
jgi:hypothetical protein